MTDERKAASNAEVESAAVSADAIAVLLSENTDIEDSSYVAVQIASLIEAGLAATLDQQVKHMVERFLRWRLPENFNPDCGITFKAIYNEHSPFGPSKAEPVGTNLFDYIQAEAMVRHMLDGLPVQAARAPQAPQGDGVVEAKIVASALDAWFPDGIPTVAVKIMFPEQSLPLTTAEVRHVLAALAPKEGAPAAGLGRAVEAAEAAVYKRHERGFLIKPLVDPIDMRAALVAAAPFFPAQAAEPVAVKVKPLEWEVDHVGGGLRAGEYRIRAGVWTHGYYWRRGEDDPHTGYPDEEDAKAAAQLDWDAYIRSGLSGAAPQAAKTTALVAQIDALLAFENAVPPIPNLARELLSRASSALGAGGAE